MHKDRGRLLILLMAFSLLGLVSQIPMYLIPSETFQVLYGSLPSWYKIFGLVSLVLGLLFIVGIGLLRKWGVVPLALSFGMNLYWQLFVVGLSNPFLPLVLGNIFFWILLWAYAIKRKWSSFS